MIVLMSGEIAVGKTVVASKLEAQYGYRRVRSGSYIAEVAQARGLATDRQGLQEMGDLLDQETEGAWIAELAQSRISQNENASHWVLDSARQDFQVFRFRDLFGAEVVHVHIMATDNELNARFHARARGDHRDSSADYKHVKASETEKHANGLGAIADIIVNSGSFTPSQIAQVIHLSVKIRSEEAAA